MRIRYHLTFGLAMCVEIAIAQKSNYISFEKFTLENSKELLYSTSVTPNFLNGGDKFWYSYTTKDGERDVLVDPEKKERKPLLDKALKVSKPRLFTNFRPPLKYYPAAFRVSPDQKYILYSKGYNLFLKKELPEGSETTGKPVDTATIQLTNDGFKDYSYQERDGDTSSGYVLPKAIWAADGRHFYMLRKDSRRLSRMTIVNALAPVPYGKDYVYELPGDKYVPQYEFSIGDVSSAKLKKVDLSHWKDQMVELKGESKDGKQVYFTRKKRTNDEIEVCAVNLADGIVKVLIHEVSKPYLNEQQAYLSFLNNDKEILWYSERSGFGHLYLFDHQGKLKNQVTKGNWVAGRVLKVDTAKREIVLEGYGREKGCNPYYAMIYKVNFDGSGLKLLTPEFADHQIRFSPSGKYFIDNFSRADLGPNAYLKSMDGRLNMKLEEADLSKLFATGWKMPETFSVKAADGKTDLYGVMWKPVNFDENKKYPLISHVYPGPQTEELNIHFSVDGNFNASLAQMGAIVVTMGHRGGSPQRSRAYHTFGYNNLRDFALADDYHAIHDLARTYSFIDTTKVGIFGHSAGGAMVVTAMCTYPDFYKVGVSASGNHDNTIYNRWWGESHQGIVEGDSTFLFDVKTNLPLAHQLKGKLMLVSGDADDNVNPVQTMRMVDALINADKDFELVMLPGQGHIYFGKSKSFFERKMWSWFDRFLILNETK
ncbi:Dipeptidyl aminopeptidase/acylaminoacyl peptidase [Pedobacter sp. ok626]|uniref:S9 family peptidase n=1 Tax=Pedobacter sp. ok626 TaxID=1761882 RepID=UPI00088F0858|nr:DPP IV N-terminal domain-containing protein [Pedobacter sp. ok626]SDL66171.1 Dipeptidyl aminopeptidase/acylaminoacyl peptidase [Pedobacter sp. ok626]